MPDELRKGRTSRVLTTEEEDERSSSERQDEVKHTETTRQEKDR